MNLSDDKTYRFKSTGKCVKCEYILDAHCGNCGSKRIKKIYNKTTKDYRFECKKCTDSSYWAHCPNCLTANPVRIFRNRLGLISTLLLLFFAYAMFLDFIEDQKLQKLKEQHNTEVQTQLSIHIEDTKKQISEFKQKKAGAEKIWKEIGETFKVLSAKIHIDEESKKISFKLTIKNERDVEISKVYFYVALNEPNKLDPIFEHSSRYGRKGNIKPGEEIVCHLGPNLTKIIEKKLLAPNNQFFLSAFIEGLEDKDGKILVDARISKEDREAFRKLETELQRLQNQINQANPK